MNPKEKFETQLNKTIQSFENETGLKAEWVEIKRENPVGFSIENKEKLKCNIKLRND
ncbi:MAG: hypothetical protein PVG65_00535 [Candidatus Thorarchaeota archaeon]|jgi:hypothetical protein